MLPPSLENAGATDGSMPRKSGSSTNNSPMRRHASSIFSVHEATLSLAAHKLGDWRPTAKPWRSPQVALGKNGVLRAVDDTSAKMTRCKNRKTITKQRKKLLLCETHFGVGLNENAKLNVRWGALRMRSNNNCAWRSPMFSKDCVQRSKRQTQHHYNIHFAFITHEINIEMHWRWRGDQSVEHAFAVKVGVDSRKRNRANAQQNVAVMGAKRRCHLQHLEPIASEWHTTAQRLYLHAGRSGAERPKQISARDTRSRLRSPNITHAARICSSTSANGAQWRENCSNRRWRGKSIELKSYIKKIILFVWCWVQNMFSLCNQIVADWSNENKGSPMCKSCSSSDIDDERQLCLAHNNRDFFIKKIENINDNDDSNKHTHTHMHTHIHTHAHTCTYTHTHAHTHTHTDLRGVKLSESRFDG